MQRNKWVQPELSWWDAFVLWVEDDATQLGISLTTYFFICALVGFIEGLAMGMCMVSILNGT